MWTCDEATCDEATCDEVTCDEVSGVDDIHMRE